MTAVVLPVVPVVAATKVPEKLPSNADVAALLDVAVAAVMPAVKPEKAAAV
jgi:hypothetical protein